MTRDTSDIETLIKNIDFIKESKTKADTQLLYLINDQIELFTQQLNKAKAKFYEFILSEYETETIIAKGNPGNPVRRSKDGFNIRILFPELISWDQQKLKMLAEKIRDQGFPIEDHLDIFYSISPERWKELSKETRTYFESIKIVNLGEPIITISKKQKEL